MPLSADVPGALFLQDWYPAGEARCCGRITRRATRCSATTSRPAETDGPGRSRPARSPRHPSGPTATVWYRLESGVTPPRYLDLAGNEVLAIPGAERAPAGRPFEAVWFTNPSGDRIQGWLIRPDGEAPFPTIVSIHGGPEYHNTDVFDARRLAYADHGFAVLLVNYRGSTGYGTAFRQRLQGDIGFPESEDVNAGLDHLIAEGIADPAPAVHRGLVLGRLPRDVERRAASRALAGRGGRDPRGRLRGRHYECAAPLRAWDVATFGRQPHGPARALSRAQPHDVRGPRDRARS